MAEVLKKFGRYFLLDQIAQGGMAEIYRARFSSMDAPGRLFVVKRIQSGFGANNEFIQMFKSEINVTMGFSHPNIVQVFDYGSESNQLFIAMEFVDGRNIRQILSRFNEKKAHVPIEVVCHIIGAAASGLHYAHAFNDKITGNSLNIVHRDISPQNIIASYDGNVKVIDFGIAKATTNVESTRAGVIKGKPSYLSPEQITGETLDGRCDLFALGIVFWELLVGKKLFAGESDLAVLKMIEACQTHVKPPSLFNPAVPKELDELVLKALSKSKNKRFQTGDEFQKAISKFMQTFSPGYGNSDFSQFLKEEFKSLIVEDKRELQRLNQKAEELLTATQTAMLIEKKGKVTFGKTDSEEMDGTSVLGKTKAAGTETLFDPNPQESPSNVTDLETKKQLRAVKSLEMDIEGTVAASQVIKRAQTRMTRTEGGQGLANANRYGNTNTGQISPSPMINRGARTRTVGTEAPQGGKKRAMFFIAAAAVVAIFVLGDTQLIKQHVKTWIGQNTHREGTGSLVLLGQAKDIQVKLNGETVGKELPLRLNSLPIGVPLKVEINGDAGHFEQEVVLGQSESKDLLVQFVGSQNQRIVSDRLDPSNDSAKYALLKVRVVPVGPGTRVVINGKNLDANNPEIKVPLKEPLELTVEREGYRPYKGEFFVDPAQLNAAGETVKEVFLDPHQFGFLTVRSIPSANVIISQGSRIVNAGRSPAEELMTPAENIKLPVGTYNVKLVNPHLNMEKVKTISIEDGKVYTVDEHLDLKN